MSIRDACDEIITVVDSDPDPGVVSVCEDLASIVIHRPMDGDFAAQRNESFSHSSCDFAMWLDSDDMVPDVSRDRIRACVDADLQGHDVATMPYIYACDAEMRPTCVLMRERIVRRSRGWAWKYPVHEVLLPTDGLPPHSLVLDAPVVHRRRHVESDRNIRIIEQHMGEFDDDERWQFYIGQEMISHGRMREAEAAYRRVLDLNGWVEHRSVASFRIAAIMAHDGRMREAAEVAHMSMEIDWRRIEPYILLGDIAAIEHDRLRAAHWYRIASHMDPCHRGLLLPTDPTLRQKSIEKLAMCKRPAQTAVTLFEETMDDDR